MTSDEFNKMADEIENLIKPYGLQIGIATADLNDPISIKMNFEPITESLGTVTYERREK